MAHKQLRQIEGVPSGSGRQAGGFTIERSLTETFSVDDFEKLDELMGAGDRPEYVALPSGISEEVLQAEMGCAMLDVQAETVDTGELPEVVKTIQAESSTPPEDCSSDNDSSEGDKKAGARDDPSLA